MTQCKDCKTFKKADNCIRCMAAQRKRAETAEAKIGEIKRISEETPFMALQARLENYFKEM